MTKIVVIVGPTASGKSALGIDLAQRFNGEIISADSMQIYQQLDIGTAKVSAAEQALVPHHLVDVVPMTANYSVADFVQAADLAIADIVARGKLPIVVGGTGFYVKALLGYLDLDWPASDAKIAAQLQQDLAASDLVTQAQRLVELAPEIANRVDLQNPQRVLRALNVALQDVDLPPKAPRPTYEALTLGLDWPREVLYDRINQRVDQMVNAGVLTEAQALLDAGGLALQAGQAIGYKEWFAYLQGTNDLQTATDLLKRNSRRYAKRQLTYFKHQLDVTWITANDAVKLVDTYLKN